MASSIELPSDYGDVEHENGATDRVRDHGPGAIPHYALPNVATILPYYANNEQDVVKQAFRPGNYTYMASVPNRIQSGFMSRARGEAGREWTSKSGGVERGAEPFFPAKAPSRGSVFQDFEYVPSLYTLADELAAKEATQSREKMKRMNGSRAFVAASSTTRQKHESGYVNAQVRPSERTDQHRAAMTYPYQGSPYEAAEDLASRERWLQTTLMLHGPVVPAGRRDPDAPTVALLPEILDLLEKSLRKDWPHTDLLVADDASGFISIRFDMSALPGAEIGVVAYMNMMANTNPIINERRLCKVVEQWPPNGQSQGRLQFAFRPPWVPAPKQGAVYYNLGL